jgi:hypothetical protein
VTIDDAYIVVNAPIVREQLQKSGLRLRICSMPLWASSDIESGKARAMRELFGVD